MIDFPHLGIHLERVGKTITIGNIDIAYYGITIALGILLGAVLAFLYARHTGQDLNDYENVLLLGIVFGIICARAYYVIFSWEDYKGDWKSILNIREGGLAIYGGVIGAFLAVFVYTRVKKLSFLQIADAVAIGFAAGQMIGRWGNFFNREAFGEYTDSLFAMRLPVDAVRSGDITEKMSAHAQEIDGVRSGITDDSTRLPVTTYRSKLAQQLYEAQRTMSASDLHISLAHEAPSDDFIYTSEDHTAESGRFLATPELIIAGHYCGGVWRMPGLGAFYVPYRTMDRGGWFPQQEDVAGLSTVGETQLFITKGMSTNALVPLMPFRLFNAPEISILTLTSTLPENMLGE